MEIIYDFGIIIYWFLANILAFFKPKAALFINGRKNWKANITAALCQNQKPVIWFHVASLGEFEQGRPVIEAFKIAKPNYFILLTFFSPSGYTVRQNYTGADYVCYLPLDTKANAHAFIAIVKPKIAAFVKYDFWYHYLQALKDSHAAIICFSAIFRPNQIFFMWYGGFFRRMLTLYNTILVQDAESKNLLEANGINNAMIAGDTRYSRVAAIAASQQKVPFAEAFLTQNTGKKVWVLGSVWPKDIDMLTIPLSAHADYCFMIAPHEMPEVFLKAIENSFATFNPQRQTSVMAHGLNPHTSCIIIDTMGILSSLYQYATYCYIGGGFGSGIHNTLEALPYGHPIFFGPNYQRFKEAHTIINHHIGLSVNDADALLSGIQYFENPSAKALCRTNAKALLATNENAATTVTNVLLQLTSVT